MSGDSDRVDPASTDPASIDPASTDPASIDPANRVDALIDPRRVASALRWNTGVTIGIAIAVPLLVAAETALIVSGNIRLILVPMALLTLVLAALFPKMIALRRSLRRWTSLSPRVMSVSDAGVHLDQIDLIGWSEIAAVLVVDDSARAARKLSAWVTRAPAQLALRSGDGSILITLVLHDGAAVRARVDPPTDARMVRLWGPPAPNPSQTGAAQRPQGGDIYVIADVLMSPDSIRHLIEVLRRGAGAHNTPFTELSTMGEYVTTLGRLLDPKWPAATTP